jgi:hypothetical protein
MRKSMLLLAVMTILGLLIGSLGIQTAPAVSLDVKPSFDKVAVNAGDAAVLTIPIANDVGVPNGTKVTISITESAKDPGVQYTVVGGRQLVGTVKGDGVAVNATATFQTDSGSSAGTITSTVAITSAKDPSGKDVKVRTATQTAIVLTVNVQVSFNPPCPPQDCSGGTNPDGGQSYGCYWDPIACDCECSPIIIDVEGHGFRLTDVDGGVLFDIRGDGVKSQMAWTAPGSGDAFLGLDRNGDGVINDGSELFGSFTPQPRSDHPNGFIALAQYDKRENGGNGDGVIDKRDRIYDSLVLWIDDNHDGISQTGELHSLASLGVEAIDLRYYEDRHHDRFGNYFKYRGWVQSLKNDHVGHWAYDVFLMIAK